MECDFHYMGWTAFICLSIHSLTNGMALGVALVDDHLTSIVFLAIIVHKFPEAFSLSSLLLAAGFRKKNIFALMFLFSIMVPLGAWIAIVFLQRYSDGILGSVLALSGGTFLHISTSDLLPTIHKVQAGKYINLISFLLGLALTLFIPEFH